MCEHNNVSILIIKTGFLERIPAKNGHKNASPKITCSQYKQNGVLFWTSDWLKSC